MKSLSLTVTDDSVSTPRPSPAPYFPSCESVLPLTLGKKNISMDLEPWERH